MKDKTLTQTEKWIKSCLKQKVSISERTLVAFLIAGTFGFVGEDSFAAAEGNSTLSITGDNYAPNVSETRNRKKNKANVGKIALGTQKLAINGTAGEITTSVTKDGQAVTISLVKALKDKINSIDNKLDKNYTTNLTIASGKVSNISEKNKTKFVTAENIKETINGVGFYVKAEANGGKITLPEKAVSTLVKAGEEVKFIAGKNVTITQNEKSFTFTVDIPNTTSVEYFSVKSTDDKNKNNDGATATNAIAIGPNATASVKDGIAIGDAASVNDKNIIRGTGGIAIGKNARSHQTRMENFPNIVSLYRDKYKMPGGIAIGQDTYAEISTIDIGNRDYIGAIGDIDFNSNGLTNISNYTRAIGATTVGDNSVNAGDLATINGAFNIISTTTEKEHPIRQGFGSSIVGTLNAIEGNESFYIVNPGSGSTAITTPVLGLILSGISSHVIGMANTVSKSNGAVILGTANEIKNSYLTPQRIDIPILFRHTTVFGPIKGPEIKELADTVRKYSQQDYRLASVGIIGGANKVDYALFSSISGVGNELYGKGKKDNIALNSKNTILNDDNLTNFSVFNQINGYENKGTNIYHTVLTGSYNEIENAEKNIITGNNHVIKGTEDDKAKGNIILGFNENKNEANFKTSGKNIVAIGNDIVASENNSVYLGTGSKNAEDTVTKGMNEYSSETVAGKEVNFAGGTPNGIVSVGSTGKERRIQNVAAGLISANSTDAINGSQLFAVAEALKNNVSNAIDGNGIKPVEVIEGTNVEVKTGTKDGNSKVLTYTINAEKTTISSADDSLITVTSGEKDKNNVTNYTIDLKEAIKAQIKGSTVRETVVAGSPNLIVKDEKENDTKGKEFTVDLAKDINLSDKGSLTIGNTVVNNNGLVINNGPSVTNTGIDAGGEVISNVKAGEKDTDAVNVSQLKAVTQEINNYGNEIYNNSQKINTLNNKINSGLANASAMTALEFQEIRINQAVVAAGVGTFNGFQAVAVGMQTAPTENIRVNVKASVSPRGRSGINTMAAVGASYKFNWK